MRAARLIGAAVPIMIAAAIGTPAPAAVPTANLSGTTRCTPARGIAYSVRVRGLTCRRGRQIATYWETTGRGHCPPDYRTRRFAKPTSTAGLGGSYLNCHRSGHDVYWVEGGE